jgi:hypothetical protein
MRPAGNRPSAGLRRARCPAPGAWAHWPAGAKPIPLLSYIDVYFMQAIIAALMVPLAMMLRPIEREPR